MDYIINGGKKLQGELPVYGAKNCALALLGATILTEENVVLRNCPKIDDVENMLLLLQSMGKRITRSGDTVEICGGLTTVVASPILATLLRGSALILGSAIGRYHQIELPLPGGCAIGSRPMDIHIEGLKRLGINVKLENDCLYCDGKPIGSRYEMRFASVGATENMLCACVLAEGESVLLNCAIEPEVVALERLLVSMGAQIDGIGTRTVTIHGVKNLHGAVFDVIPDRIVAATYLSAAIATYGNVTVTGCCVEHIQSFLNLLKSRFELNIYSDAVQIRAECQPTDYGCVVTAPYPYFPTDMQSLVLSLAAFSRGGKTVICEKLFENRLQHNANELNKMGANVTVKDDCAIAQGRRLNGAGLRACDLRGGAGLIVAALNADGESVVSGIEHVNRGYIDLASQLKILGADIAVD